MSEILSDPLIDAAMGPEPEAEPAWTGPSQDDWGQVQNTMGYLAEWVQSQQAPEGSEQMQIDPFADDFGEQLAGYVTQAVQQSLAPVMDWQHGQQMSDAEERALDILEDIVSREGEFINKEQSSEFIRAYANVLMPDMAQRHGYGPQAAEAALEQAAKTYRALEQSVGTAYHEQQMNLLTNLSGAGRELGVSGVGAQQVVTTPGGDELDLVRKYVGFRAGV